MVHILCAKDWEYRMLPKIPGGSKQTNFYSSQFEVLPAACN